ncbi:metal ABC transporter ATP-binding protein [Vallicoccus soli]|uniref:Metal ABC transporter ATP-binding protein n=1 Tax=Vallicoccus soli TaxID=2339232 RepID=A0A3A3Z860_9ACTN|nr:metal ABC transporter ATP-binding protein [Vallicoccus soli]RJK97027.1 metal ABC transporter ATP-binding protein [Vallicoccus soli]
MSAARPAEPVVRLAGAVAGYEGRPVLRGVDFALRRGEVVALLGPNGSGKSTLVRVVLGLVPLSGGALELFGVPAQRFRERARIGYVPQRHTVTSGVPSTVREVVASGRLARKRPFSLTTARDREVVEAALRTVHLLEKQHEDVAHLSGGQQRRTLIARALASEPEVLVMDEPTAGVDAANQEILADTMARLVAGGTTILLVAHELGPLEPVVTRVVALRDGRATYDGPVAAWFGGDPHHAHGAAPAERGTGLGAVRLDRPAG